jgi:CubicO group peptidase (beta-lactamase class C family)
VPDTSLNTSPDTPPAIDGFTAPGWEGVRDAFTGNFARHGEIGAAVCVYHAGQPVADLAAGLADPAAGRPYTRQTMQPFMSVSKGIVAIAANMLADRQVIDLDAPVARYWPEFGRAGKETIPVRWLLTHQAGLAALDRPLSRAELLSWTPVIRALEEQSPNWPPGTAHGYHSMTYGFLVGEVIRRVTGKLPGPWIAEHIAGPLGADCHLGLPPELRGTVAPVLPFPPAPEGRATTLRMEPGSLPYRAALGSTSPPLGPLAVNDPEIQAAQLPAANGIGSARGLARIFAAVIGEVGGVRLMSARAMEEARREQVRGPDLAAAAMTESALGLGFTLPTAERPLGGPGSFGSVGLGGCRAWALPEAALAFAYLPVQLLDVNPDPREQALAAATLAAASLAAAPNALGGAPRGEADVSPT